MTEPIDQTMRQMAQLDGLRALALKILTTDPAQHLWTLQGLGMLRLHLDGAATRLHIWDPRYATPNVSTIHDHPWDFVSTVIAGEIIDTVYVSSLTGGQPYQRQRIFCGEGGGLVGGPGPISLVQHTVTKYHPGHSYHHGRLDIHETGAFPGTVTIVRRTFTGADRDHARVYWPGTQAWVSAEPRKATDAEVEVIIAAALPRLMQKDGKR